MGERSLRNFIFWYMPRIPLILIRVVRILTWNICFESPVKSPHKDQWRGALKFSLIRTRSNGWANNRDAGDLGRHRAHYCGLVRLYGSTYLDQHWFIVLVCCLAAPSHCLHRFWLAISMVFGPSHESNFRNAQEMYTWNAQDIHPWY